MDIKQLKDSLRIKKITDFIKKHPIWLHSFLILITGSLLVWIAFFALDIFTEHGSYKVVPKVKNMLYGDAIAVIEAEDFKYNIIDSVYDNKLKPGQIAEQIPTPGSHVKSIRTIYLIINAFNPCKITLPNVRGLSLREAEAVLNSQGIRNIREKMIPSPHKLLVLECKDIHGNPLVGGNEILSTEYIVLEYGAGSPTDEKEDNSEKEGYVDLSNFGHNDLTGNAENNEI